MTRPRVPLGPAALVLVAGLAVVALAAGPAQATHDDPGANPNATRHPDGAVRYVVGLESGGDRLRDVDVGDAFHTATVVDRDPVLDFLVVEASSPEAFWLGVRTDPAVRYLEEDPERKLVDFSPDDPLWDESGMYGARQVRADEVWGSVGTGDTSAQVCVVDTGVRYTHEDLEGERWLGGHDFHNDDGDPWDDHGHGTHVSGTAAAWIGNGEGIAGMGNVGLYGVKVLSAGGFGTWSDVASGIRWCADNGGERTVVSMSLGGSSGSQAVQDAARYAREQGALVVSSAGNSGCCDSVTYPAKYPEVMAVTCTNADREICSFSSRGPEAEIAAPGRSILSSCAGSDADYCHLSGTSMSAPHVSGAAALTWSMTAVDAGPNATELRERLRETAGDLGEEGWDPEYGHGLLDVRNLSAPVTLDATRGPDRGDITLNWSLADPVDDGNLTGFRVLRTDDPDTNLTEIATLPADNRSFVDTGLGDGTTRYYQVVATNDTGGTLPSTVQPATTITHPQAPLQPQTERGPDDGEITLAWEPPADDGGRPVTDYHVHRTDPDGTEAVVASVANTTYVDSGLANDTSYRYRVAAENEVDVGPYSDLVEGTTPGPPEEPTNLATRSGPDRGEVTVGWEIPLDDGGYPITAYHLYRTNPDGTRELVATLNDTTYVDGDLPDDTSYAYEVSAENEKGEGPATDPVDGATPGPPGEPVALEVRRGPGAGELNLSWHPPGGTHEGPTESDGWVGDTGTFVTMDHVEGQGPVDVTYRYCYLARTHDRLGYIDTVFDGEIVDTHGFRHPYTGAGECDEDDPSTFATRSFTVDESVNETVRLDYRNGDFRLVIADVTVEVSDAILPVEGYEVYRTNPDGSTVHAGNTTSRGFVDAGLEDNTTYSYEVSATNVVGEGPLGSPAEGTTPEPPSPPAGVEVERGDDLGELVVHWDPPVDDGGSDVLFYHAYRTDPDGSRTLAGTAASSPFTDTGLENATTYTYELTAESEAGEGSPSAPADGTTAQPPTPPENLAGTAGPGAGNVTLDWDPPADGGGTAIVAYHVYREDPDGSTTHSTVSGPPYRDAGLEDNTTYAYRVSAENSLGEGDATVPLNVTSPRLPDPPGGLETVQGPGAGEVTLDWQPPGDDGGIAVDAYHVYRTDADGTTTRAGTTNETGFVDGGLADDTTYTYTVSTVNDVGEGPVADPVAGQTPGPPDTPELFGVERGSGAGEIDLDWDRAAISRWWRSLSDPDQETGTLVSLGPAFEEAPVEVEYSYCYVADTTEEEAAIHTVFDDEVVDTHGFRRPYTGGDECSADALWTYEDRSFTVDAADLSGEVRFTYENGDGQVAIGDIRVEARETALPVTAYNVYRTGPDGNETLAGSAAPSDRTFTDTGLEENTTYEYEIAAVNDAGESPRTYTDGASTLARPYHVEDLAAEHRREAVGWTVHLSWAPPVGDGGDPLDAYRVYRGTSPDDVTTLVATVAPDETSYDDRPPAYDVPRNYYYQVAAENDVGEGPRVETVCISASPLHDPVADRVAPCHEDSLEDELQGEAQAVREEAEATRQDAEEAVAEAGETPGTGSVAHGAVRYGNVTYRSAQNALESGDERGRDGPSRAHLDATQRMVDLVLVPTGQEARFPEGTPRYGGETAVNGSTVAGPGGASDEGDLGMAFGIAYGPLDHYCLGSCVSVTDATGRWAVGTLEGETVPAGPAPNAAADEAFRAGHEGVDAVPALP